MANAYTESMNRLMVEFARIPGIGEKTAERCAYHILKAPRDEAMKLAYAIRDVKNNIRHCGICYNIAESEPCAICADPAREAGQVCVVEQPRDVIALEKVGAYRGRYHVLMGALSPLDGVRPEDLSGEALRKRVESGGVEEVILATNPTLEGDATARFLQDLLAPTGVRLTRIARGIPSGSSIEHVSKTILADALEGRRPVSP
ncbi:MAG: recombination protein RecR [Planctomycetes bacterium]|nr:recombination protein RecR [Planctomycetota bacterium]